VALCFAGWGVVLRIPDSPYDYDQSHRRADS
jgi:hypothetical protein